MSVGAQITTSTRRQKCLQCGKDRMCDYGSCRECQGTPRPDGESPGVLTGRWVFNPVTRIRDYQEQP